MMSLQPGIDLSSIATLLALSAGPAPHWMCDSERLLLSPPSTQPQSRPAHPPPQQADAQPQEAEISMPDWNLLLDAVKDRLRQVVGVPTALLQAAVLAPDVARRVQSSVLECIDALNLLQVSMVHAQDRRQFLEDALRVAQVELVQTRADLAGIRAGEMEALDLSLHDGLTLLPNRG